jgi:glycosyltransferase involved in cell wall biosynthesis
MSSIIRRGFSFDKTTLIIPTYNERQNLPALLEEIFKLDITDLHVLIVDDNSPDGTGVLAEDLKATYPENWRFFIVGGSWVWVLPIFRALKLPCNPVRR